MKIKVFAIIISITNYDKTKFSDIEKKEIKNWGCFSKYLLKPFFRITTANKNLNINVRYRLRRTLRLSDINKQRIDEST